MAQPSRYLLVAAFFGMLLLPVGLFGVDIGATDYFRGDFPSSFSRKTPHEFERWFSTRLGYRLLRMRIGARIQFGILQRSTSPLVAFGADDWLFTADSGDSSGPPPRISDFRGVMRLDARTISRISDNLVQTRATLAQCGISFVALVAPNKQSIYGDRLANSGWPTETRLTNLIANLSPEAREVLEYPRDDMLRYKAAHPDLWLYYKTGSHWTDMGAWVAYSRMVDSLKAGGGIFAPELAALDHFGVDVVKINGENMDLVIRYAKELFTDFDVRLVSKVPAAPIVGTHSTEPIIPAGFEKTEYINPQGKGRLLYVGDSFGAKLVPLLARHFEVASYFDYPFLTRDLVIKYKPDVVVLESIERNLEKLAESTNRLDAICPIAGAKR